MRQIQFLDAIDLEALAQAPLDARTYALAWAAAYHLFPGYQPGDKLPARLMLNGSFPIRTLPLRITIPPASITPMRQTQIEEFLVELHARVPQAPQASQSTNEAETLFLEGLRLADAGKALEAVPTLEKACQLRPSNSSWWHALALAYQEAQRPADARNAAQRALDTASNTTEESAARALLNSL